MEQLICNMMQWANVSEAELAEKLEISTTFGETLSWKYLCYVREHPISWKIPTRILYGEKDALTSMETIKAFAEKNNAELTVMPGGEHWFHTKEQMQFLDYWIKNRRPCNETENKDGFASPAYSSGNRAGSLPCLQQGRAVPAGPCCSDPSRFQSQRVTYMYAKEKQQR